MEVTLEQLTQAIKGFNLMNAPSHQQGRTQFDADVRDLIEGMGLFAKPEVQWKMITSGPMASSRYCVTPHGFVVQAPQPVNEMSLIPFETGKLLGMTR